MITGAQIRAARALLGWSGRALAKKADVPDHSLEWIEGDGTITAKDRSALKALQDALEEVGVEFIGSFGVQLRADKRILNSERSQVPYWRRG